VNAITSVDTTPDERPAPSSRRHRGPRWLVLAVLVVAAGAGTVVVTHPFDAPPAARGAGNAAGTSLATVTCKTLTAQTQVDGTLGYSGS
jgi:hypothetical protein